MAELTKTERKVVSRFAALGGYLRPRDLGDGPWIFTLAPSETVRADVVLSLLGKGALVRPRRGSAALALPRRGATASSSG